MCNGTATQLLCSHYLIHWSGPRCPKKCILPAHRTWLNCTCADCDPDHSRTRILLRYAAEREVLAARILQATAEGRSTDARVLERQLRTSACLQMEDLSRTRFSGLDPAVGCRWPGCYEQWVEENLGRPVDWDLLLNM